MFKGILLENCYNTSFNEKMTNDKELQIWANLDQISSETLPYIDFIREINLIHIYMM